MFSFLKSRRRRRLRERPFPEQWRAILRSDVPYYCDLPDEQRSELEARINVFLAEKTFLPAGGIERITDEMRVTIAAQACILLLGRPGEDFGAFKTIILYPRSYFSTSTTAGPGGVVTEADSHRLGEAWRRGPVVLSWCDVLKGAADPHDGHNVVFHELAHQLDYETGDANGAPRLRDRAHYSAWSSVFGAEFNALHAELAHRQRTLLTPYSATSPAEFFAGATELFFERPGALRARHPELYEQLRTFYNQDPAQWRRLGGADEPRQGAGDPPICN